MRCQSICRPRLLSFTSAQLSQFLHRLQRSVDVVLAQGTTGTGHPADADVLKAMPPYRQEHINRLGDYLLDQQRRASPLDPTIDLLQISGLVDMWRIFCFSRPPSFPLLENRRSRTFHLCSQGGKALLVGQRHPWITWRCFVGQHRWMMPPAAECERWEECPLLRHDERHTAESDGL